MPDGAKDKKEKGLPRPFLGCGALLTLPLLVSALVAGEVAEVGSPRLMCVVSQAHRDLGDPPGTCWSLEGYAVVVSCLHLIPSVSSCSPYHTTVDCGHSRLRPKGAVS